MHFAVRKFTTSRTKISRTYLHIDGNFLLYTLQSSRTPLDLSISLIFKNFYRRKTEIEISQHNGWFDLIADMPDQDI